MIPKADRLLEAQVEAAEGEEAARLASAIDQVKAKMTALAVEPTPD